MADEHVSLGIDAQEAFLSMSRDVADMRMEVDDLRSEAMGQLARSRLELLLAATALVQLVVASTGKSEQSRRAFDRYRKAWDDLLESLSDVTGAG